MLSRENERYTLYEFLLRNDISEDHINAMNVLQLEQRFRIDYKTATYLKTKVSQPKTPIGILVGHPLFKYLHGASIIEFASQSSEFLTTLALSFLEHNVKAEILLFEQLPTTIERLQELPHALLPRISIFNLNQHSLYNNLELVYEKARTEEIELIVFDSIFEQLQDSTRFNQISARLGLEAPVFCFNELIEHQFERGDAPAFHIANDAEVFCTIEGLPHYYTKRPPTAREFGVIEANKLFSPGYTGKSAFFNMRVIEYGEMFYIWDGRAEMWTVNAPAVEEV